MIANGTLRVGVVGCGYWGPKHVRIMYGLEQASSVALIDKQADRLKALSRSFPGVSTYSSLREALPEVDAVVIATPPSTHVPLARAAVEAGKHVLVEKPLAPRASEAETLVEEAAKAGVTLMVGHTFLYNPAVRKLHEIVTSGELGELYYLDSARLNLGLYQQDANVVLDLAPHDISIMNFLLGGPPNWVEAWGSRHAHRRFEDVAYMRLYYRDRDVFANVHVSWLDPCKVRRVTAVGSRKMAVYNDLASEERIRLHDKGVLRVGEDDATQPPMSYRYGDITAPYISSQEPLAVQDQHFVTCCLTGLRPDSDGVDGLGVVRVLDAAQRSLETGRRVHLEEFAVGLPAIGLESARRGAVPPPRDEEPAIEASA